MEGKIRVIPVGEDWARRKNFPEYSGHCWSLAIDSRFRLPLSFEARSTAATERCALRGADNAPLTPAGLKLEPRLVEK